MTTKIVQVAMVIVVGMYLRSIAGDDYIYTIDAFQVHLLIAAIFSGLSIFVPKKFAMGLNKYKEANILEKLSPLAFSFVMLMVFGLMPQTITIVIVTTFFFSQSICYLSYIASSILVQKIKRFAR